MTQTPNRLHKHMADVVALEAAIAQALDQLIMESANHPEVTAMLQEFHAMTKGQLYALDTRLQTLANNMPIPDRTAAVRPDGESGDGNTYPVSTALQTAYTLFNHALIEYAALQVLAIRFRDSWAIAADGTTAHLARQHIHDLCEGPHFLHLFHLVEPVFEREMSLHHALGRLLCGLLVERSFGFLDQTDHIAHSQNAR